MQSQKNKWIGVGIFVLSLTVSAFLFWYFDLNGKAIDFNNPTLLSKFTVVVLWLIVSLYLGLYFAAGKKVALQISGALMLFMAAVYIFRFSILLLDH